MTRFGKILVLINLALSLVFAAWALAFRTQRVDWTAARVVPKENTIRAPNPSGKPITGVSSKETSIASATKDPTDPTVVQIKGLQEGTTSVVLTEAQGQHSFDVHVDEGVPGKLAERIDEIRALQEVRLKLEGDYQVAYQDIAGLDKQRPENRKWYEDQLRYLDRGVQRGDEPVNAVAYTNGEPQIDSQDRPVMVKAATQALPQILPRAAYEAKIDQLAGQIEGVRKQISDQIAQQTKLAEQLKELRAKLAVEEEALEKFAAEREELTPQVYNREAEAQTVRDRRQRLDTRIQELKRAGANAP